MSIAYIRKVIQESGCKACSLYNRIFLIGSLSLGFLTSCNHKHLSVNQQTVDSSYLASMHAKTPDPRQENPPFGQLLIVEWLVPKYVVLESPEIVLDVIYWDYSQETVRFPLKKRGGYELFFLTNDKFLEKKGFLTYMVQIIGEDGTVHEEWKHQLWVNLITFDEEKEEEELKQLGESHAPLFTEEEVDETPYDDEDDTEEPQFEPSPELSSADEILY